MTAIIGFWATLQPLHGYSQTAAFFALAGILGIAGVDSLQIALRELIAG